MTGMESHNILIWFVSEAELTRTDVSANLSNMQLFQHERMKEFGLGF